MRGWHLPYLGKPWESLPSPPGSYNCGVLVTSVYRDVLGVDLGEVRQPGADLAGCIGTLREAAVNPALWGLARVPEGERPRDLDVVFLARLKFEDHCGLAVDSGDGLLVLHCIQGGGVVLDDLFSLAARGFPRTHWFRRAGA
jgi:hypothetical protein